MVWIKIWENVIESNKYTNKEIEEKFSLDYEEAIKTLGLDKDNWQKLKEQFRIDISKLRKIEDLAPEDIDLPEEIAYDSDCDGYDTCWINKWHFTEDGLLIFERYLSCSNKQYGKYDSNAPNTLLHKLAIYRKKP